MNLVSVIIPYFKKKKFIKKTIKSVIKQTYTNIEVIIIYDDEKKKDLEYILKIKSIDKRIKLIINKKNKGAGESRNIGISKSKGSFISFIDSDDVWKKNKIEKQLNYMIKNNIKISHTSYAIINSLDQITGYRKAKKYDDFYELLKSCDIGLSTVLMKKSLFSKNIKFPKIKTKEDFVLWLKLLKEGNIIYSINDQLSSWRKTDTSLSSSKIQKIQDGFLVYNNYMKFSIIKSVYYLFILSINYLKKITVNK